MSFDPENVTPPGAKIKVFGVGGGGGNAVNTMIRSGLEGVEFITANTDVQALRFSLAGHKLQVGKDLTRGLGAGADPDIGRDAALEDRHEIQECLAGSDMVFITAGMGGGTGTGGASVVAQIARELGALTVAVVTKPFAFEGKRRRKHAEVGVARLRECVDTLITIPNQRLLQVASPNTSMIDAFKMADEVLVNAVRGISDIINIPGMVNVDFADVKTVMSCMGQALMGIGSATGETRASDAARQAISSPLLEDIDIEGATGILINITAGSDVTLMEVNEACSIIQEAAHEDANIIFGTVIDETLGGVMRVTVIATGFPVDKENSESDSGGQIVKPQPQQIISPYATRLTSPGLITTPKPTARPTQPHHYPLTTQRKPEAPRPVAAQPVVTQHVTVHAPVRETAPQPAPAPVAQPSPGPVVTSFAGATATPEIRHEPIFEQPVHVQAPVAQHHEPAQPEMHARDEAQELARWTLDNLAGSEFAPSDDIPSLASEASPLLSHDARLEGASAYGEPQQAAQPTSLAETLFGAGFAPAESYAEAPEEHFLLAEPEQQAAQHDQRPGAVKESAPLETFFDTTGTFIASDIDRKIDEALELAERMRAPRKPTDTDDLDVPAFLRNGMKDLPLD